MDVAGELGSERDGDEGGKGREDDAAEAAGEAGLSEGAELSRRRQTVPRRAIRDRDLSFPIKRIPCAYGSNSRADQPLESGLEAAG